MRRDHSIHEVRFANLSMRYGKRVVLNLPTGGFSLATGNDGGVDAMPAPSAGSPSAAIAKTGRVIGLFGPNGAGKTTFIRMLAGMSEQFRGTLTAPDPDEIAYVPDVPYLYPFLSIKSCIAQFERRYADFNAAKANRLVQRLRLPIDRPLRTFSKGQSEQLHLVLAFSRVCPLYVLDEPFAAVDSYTRDKLLDVVRESADANATVLISTHIIFEIEQLFSRVIMIDGGQIIANADVVPLQRESGGLEQAFKNIMRRRDESADISAHTVIGK